MGRSGAFIAASAALLLCAFPLASAHGDESMDDMNMGQANTSPGAGIPAPQTSAMASSYFTDTESAGLIYAHIAFMVIGWFLVLPICVMLSLARSYFALPAQLSFLIVNALGLLLGTIYNTRTPDLYPNNAHHKIGWVATWAVCAQVAIGLVFVYSGRSKEAHVDLDEHTGFLPVSVETMAQHQQVHSMVGEHEYRWSNDSGQGTERNSASLHSGSTSPTTEREDTSEFERFFKPEVDEEVVTQEPRRLFRNTVVDRFMSRLVPGPLSDRLLQALEIMDGAVDRLILLVGFILVATGFVTFGGLFHGDNIFNGLAHFVKGGIFFWYGLLTLGRYVGCFAEFGWAWNVKPSRAIVGRWKSSLPSAEFTESFVIFLYGCTNVFLEHLAAWGDAWAAEDLEHVAISIMFFGGGLCGMLVESQRIRDLLNTSFLLLTPAGARTHGRDEGFGAPKTYQIPLNPIPALIILLLGMMMSSHHQHSMLSSMIHRQWGTLLMGFSLVRGVTYLLLYITPPTSLLPSRPPTELISAFCLISGGLVFMASNKDTVSSMETYNLNAMFAFTLTMGFTAFLMAWVIIVLGIKGWAVRREANARKNTRF